MPIPFGNGEPRRPQVYLEGDAEVIEYYRQEESWGRFAHYGWWTPSDDINMTEVMFGNCFVVSSE